jgi:tryptophan-rich sensory protein
MKPGSGRKLFKLLLSIAICEVAGLLSSIFTASSISTWYARLNKPSFNPPNWLFGPVWTSLYLLMGISAYLIWRDGLAERKKKKALLLFLVQLVLNAAWTPVFFGLRNPAAALVLIVLLWAAILVTILSFRKISTLAAGLLIPYILWVSFACILNAAIAILN